MTKTLRDMMTERAERAPAPRIDIDGVVQAGRHRVWRHRALGGAAACAALVAAALVAPALPFVGGNNQPAVSDAPGERQISYASGSTIHYGDQSIDVAPHEISSYVLTDDGFVYAALNGDVYFTDGDGSEQIGHAGDGNRLVADQTGSYVGWTETEDSGADVVVVYDTDRGGEVFRSPKDDGSSGGCYSEDGGLALSAIDGDTAYVCGGSGTTAWNLLTQTEQGTTPPRPGSVRLTAAANGYLAWAAPDGLEQGTIVSRDPDADRPFYREVSAGVNGLSPDADYLAGVHYSADGTWRTLLFDRASNHEVRLAMPSYHEWYVLQWLDDDRFTAVGYDAEDYEGAAADAPELLTCDVPAATCTVVGQASGSYILVPDGQSYWS